MEEIKYQAETALLAAALRGLDAPHLRALAEMEQALNEDKAPNPCSSSRR